ncbi:MAG: type III ribulose-bisphosphate carboxylase [Candidatus Korarchaeota archaeon]
MGFEWYGEFVDLKYVPSKNDTIALFRAKPAENMSFEDIAGRIASESSVGTWTTLSTLTEYTRTIMARVFKIEPPYLRVAYPIDLFEPGNVVQMLTCYAGNIYGMRAIEKLRLIDVSLPEEIVKSFKGPQFGIEGVRKILKVYDRPLTATVPKPKVGLTTDEYAKTAYDILAGGVDLLKDDENLGDLSFNRFEARVKAVMKVIDKVENETGERKGYLANITGETKEMEKKAKLVADYGNKFIMVDFVLAGWSALMTIRNIAQELGLAIHAHRAFHAAYTRDVEHGMSMLLLAKMARLIGVDHIHIGAAVGKMEAAKQDVLAIQRVITQEEVQEENHMHLHQKWYGLKPVVPTISGGLHIGLLPDVVQIHGKDILIQVGGGVTGHPDGSYAGAVAVRQALDAVNKGIPLNEYAKDHKELARGLEKWGYIRPK